MIDFDDMKPGMPVVCSNGGLFAVVDHLDGEATVKLKKDDAGMHHFMPATWVTAIKNGAVYIDRPGTEAMAQWWTAPREQPVV